MTSVGCFLFLACFLVALVSADYGILNLDNSTITKLVDGSRPAFICFNREYPYGDKHDAFKAFAVEVAQGRSDLVIGLVGIGTYGDKPNQDLAEKFGMKKPGTEIDYKDLDERFPQFLFFPKGTGWNGKFVKYEGSVTAHDITLFLKLRGVAGLQGTIPALDVIAAKFVKADAAARKKLTEEATQVTVQPEETEVKEYYLKAMQRINEKGDAYVSSEIKRLENLQTTAVTKDKKDQFKKRAVVLSSFLSDEL